MQSWNLITEVEIEKRVESFQARLILPDDVMSLKLIIVE